MKKVVSVRPLRAFADMQVLPAVRIQPSSLAGGPDPYPSFWVLLPKPWVDWDISKPAFQRLMTGPS